jgi:hypothetical protein
MTDWNRFRPTDYAEDNYLRELRDDDRELLELTASWFTSCRPSGRALDVGAGSNLYPSLAMLPFATTLDLYDPGALNVQWLRGQVQGFGAEWDPYWQVLCDAQPDVYKALDPRQWLARLATVRNASVDYLRAGQWELGTMFFCAESSTDDRRLCNGRFRRFVHALRPGAPFAIGAMRDSFGYTVGGVDFPATPMNDDDVRDVLGPVACDLQVHTVKADPPLREGYQGMLLATGRAL